jgi:hypothetical protein
MSATEQLSAALDGRYRIERELGAGGMATVYLAHDIRHGRKVAIKVLKPELAAVLGAERFVVEIKTTAALSHPHILPLFDSGEAEGFLFYVMPYIEGETIREKLNRETQFAVDEAVRIAREVADALDYAHRHGVIHRDIKPENILLHDGRAMVMDFGIALAVSAAAGGRMTETGLSLGTPHYMSPEQATADKTLTARSDVYSLGSVLYEMLAGDPPHTGASAQQIIMKIIAEPVQPVAALRRSVPPNVAAAVSKALEKLPADRFESARAFAAALENTHFTAGTAAQVVQDSAIAKRRWLFTAGIAVAGAMIGASVVALVLARREGMRRPAFAQRTFGREAINNARWAADGKTILFTAVSMIDGRPRVRIIRPEYPEPQPFGPEVAHLLAVSSTNEVALLLDPTPVSQRVYRGTLARMSIGGGAPRAIVEAVQEADWSPDGTQLAITRRVGDHDQIEYPAGKVIYSSTPGSYVSDIRVSGDGTRVAFFMHPLRGDDRGFVAIVDAKDAVTKFPAEFAGLEGLAWASDDRSVLFSAATNFAYEVYRWTPGRAPERALPVPGRLTMYDVRAGHWLVSRDDNQWLVVAKSPGASGVRDISWLDGSIGAMISSDGEMVAFSDEAGEMAASAGERKRSGALYSVMIRKSDGSPAIRLGEGSARAISPDKKWVLGQLPTSPPRYRVYPTGAGSFKSVAWSKLVRVLGATFADGKSLYVCGQEADHAPRCYLSALEGGDITTVTPDSVFGLLRPDLKAVAAARDGKYWIYPLDGGARREIPGLQQAPLRWSPDGSGLWVFRNGSARQRGVDRVDVVTGKRTPLLTIDELQGVATPRITSLGIADDGKSYVYCTASHSSLLFSVDGMR